MRDSTNEVLRAIAVSGPISRAQLARDLGLSGPTLTQATKYLLNRGLISEESQTPSTGGRPATLLRLAPNAGKVLGVKLAEDHLVAICANLNGEIQWSDEMSFSARGEEAIQKLAKVLEKYSDLTKGELLGIGIGIPGVVSPMDSSTANSVILDWNELEVGKILSEKVGCPVLLENDVNTLAIAESLFGRAKDVSNFLTLTLGRGIGLGIVINGDLFTGSYGAGEIGHVTSIKNGQLCECGKRGCLETFASDPAILKKAIKDKVISKNSNINELWLLARKDAQIATQYFKVPAEHLGMALANVINIFGPELVLVSGEGSEGWDIWSKWVLKTLNENVVPTMKKYELELEPWGDQKWALGATSLVLQASLSATSNNKSVQEIKNRLRVVK